MKLEALLTQLEGVSKTASGFLACCPAHSDRRASLSVSEGADGKLLVKCFAGCETERVVQALGLTMKDLFADTGGPDTEPRIVKTYDYRDETGTLLYQVVRRDPKDFRPRRPDSHGGWVWNLDGTRRIPYRLHDLVKAKPKAVYICEGEKDADRLWSLGLPATCNPGGAGKWKADYTDCLVKLLGPVKVVILADNDDPGQKHAVQVARSWWGKAEAVKLLLALPGVPDKGDVSDYLTMHSKGALIELVKTTPALTLEELERLESKREKPDDVVIIRLTDVKPEPVTWLWPGRIPMGKVTLLDGDPGLGKSTLAFDIAARASTGSAMPDGSQTQPGGAVILTLEDGLADTVVPRLKVAGADLNKIVALQGVKSADGRVRIPTVEDIAALTSACQQIAAKIVIIDPLMAYLPTQRNSWRDQDVRQALAPLAKMAEEIGVAVLVIRHLNKSGGSQSIYRGGGSIGIIGAARSALLVAKDPEDEARRVLAGIKSNLAPIPKSLAFRVETVDGTACIVWEGTSSHTADALLAAPVSQEERSVLEDAADFLRSILEKGPVEVKQIQRAARQAGIADATLRRAKSFAGVTSKRDKFGEGGKWFWSLDAQKVSKVLIQNSEHLRGAMSILGDFEEV